MKRLGILAMVLTWLLCSTAAWADFYVIAGSGPPVGTKITSVPYTISTPGFYYFNRNLNYGGSGGTAITISADDVTLDLMGFSLTNSATGFSHGILMDGRTNVEIRNGTVRDFDYGIYEASSSGSKHSAINVRLTGNSYGIYFNGSNHLIKGCNGSNNLHLSLFIDSGLITNCVACNNSLGIVMHGPGNLLANTAFNNSVHNFDLGNGVATAIMADRNSAFGLATNYYVEPGTTGVQWGINAGSP